MPPGQGAGSIPRHGHVPAWHQLSLRPPTPSQVLLRQVQPQPLKQGLPQGNQRGDIVRRGRGKKRRNVQFCASGERDIFNKHSINCQQDLVAFFIVCKMLRELQTALGGSLAAPRPSVRCCVQIKSSTRAALPRQIPPGPLPALPPPPPSTFCWALGAGLVPPTRGAWGPLQLPGHGAHGDGGQAVLVLQAIKPLSSQEEGPPPRPPHPDLAGNQSSATGTSSAQSP